MSLHTTFVPEYLLTAMSFYHYASLIGKKKVEIKEGSNLPKVTQLHSPLSSPISFWLY